MFRQLNVTMRKKLYSLIYGSVLLSSSQNGHCITSLLLNNDMQDEKGRGCPLRLAVVTLTTAQLVCHFSGSEHHRDESVTTESNPGRVLKEHNALQLSVLHGKG